MLFNDEDETYRLTDEEHKLLGYASKSERGLKVHAVIADLANAREGLKHNSTTVK